MNISKHDTASARIYTLRQTWDDAVKRKLLCANTVHNILIGAAIAFAKGDYEAVADHSHRGLNIFRAEKALTKRS
jgi:hypothetical protein